jgi:hypothetical protein
MLDRESTKFINQLTRQSPFYEKFSQPRYAHLKGYPEHDAIAFELAKMMTSYQYYDPSFFNTVSAEVPRFIGRMNADKKNKPRSIRYS